MSVKKSKPIIFGETSIAYLPAEIKSAFEIKPPVKKGDLAKIKSEQPILIADGFFSGALAISPRECREYLRSSRILLGCSSMGAIRAAELWQDGMIGIGSIYNMFRLGHLQSDADVAVLYGNFSTSNNKSIKELTYSVAHIAYVISVLEKLNFLDAESSFKLIRAAQKIYFEERDIFALLNQWKKCIKLSKKFEEIFCEYINSSIYHPKIKDAHEAVGYLLPHHWPSPPDITVSFTKTSTLSGDNLLNYRKCKYCSGYISTTAIFCAHCASYAHENQ